MLQVQNNHSTTIESQYVLLDLSKSLKSEDIDIDTTHIQPDSYSNHCSKAKNLLGTCEIMMPRDFIHLDLPIFDSADSESELFESMVEELFNSDLFEELQNSQNQISVEEFRKSSNNEKVLSKHNIKVSHRYGTEFESRKFLLQSLLI